VLALALAPSLACAQDATFGSPGQMVVSGSVAAELELGSGSRGSDHVERSWSIGLQPSFLYFVARDLAVGCAPFPAYEDNALDLVPYTEVELGGSAGAGWNLPLADGLSLFTQLWIGLGHMHRRYAAVMTAPIPFLDPAFTPAEPDRTIAGWFVTAQLPLLLQLQLGPATYLAIGPRVRLRMPFDEGLGLFRVGGSASFGGFF